MKKRIQLFEVLLAGVLMAFAWTLRGQFGPLQGGLIPGEIGVVILAFLMREEHWRESMGKALLLAPLGFALGGLISHGQVFEAVAHAAAFGVARDEFVQLFWIGLVWGGLGGTFLGFGFSEKPVNKTDLLILALVFFGAFFPLPKLAYFSIALIFIQIYNFAEKKSILLPILTLTGALSFGAAFLLAGILLSAGYQGLLGETWAWWTYSDLILGFTAGIFFWGMTAGLQQFRLRRFPAEAVIAWQQAGFSFWLIFITGANALDSSVHWLRVKHSGLEIYFGIQIFILAVAVWLALSKNAADYFNPKLKRTLRNTVIFTFSVWTFQAVLKWSVVFGSWK